MSRKDDNSGYVLIGAGLPRTGTTSLYTALKQILGPTYHMDAVFRSSGTADPDFWLRAQKKMVTADEWKKFVSERGLRAGVDYPISHYWKEQMRIFPEAKVILTVRSPDTWYKSVKGTILQFSSSFVTFPYSTFFWIFGKAKHTRVGFESCWAIPEGFDISMFGAVTESQEKATEFYHRWVEEVKATVPKERLLIFEAKDGWGPLCKFLDLPVPANPYPHVNDSKSMISQVNIFWKVVQFTLVAIPALVAAVTYRYYY